MKASIFSLIVIVTVGLSVESFAAVDSKKVASPLSAKKPEEVKKVAVSAAEAKLNDFERRATAEMKKIHKAIFPKGEAVDYKQKAEFVLAHKDEYIAVAERLFKEISEMELPFEHEFRRMKIVMKIEILKAQAKRASKMSVDELAAEMEMFVKNMEAIKQSIKSNPK